MANYFMGMCYFMSSIILHSIYKIYMTQKPVQLTFGECLKPPYKLDQNIIYPNTCCCNNEQEIEIESTEQEIEIEPTGQ